MKLNKNTKAVLIGLCTAALLDLLIFAGAAGFFLAFTLAPLLAGYISGKLCNRYRFDRDFTSKSMSQSLGKYDLKKKSITPVVIGTVWSIIQILLLVLLLSSILPWLSMKIGALEILIFILIFCFNICFCMLGSKLACSEPQKQRV